MNMYFIKLDVRIYLTNPYLMCAAKGQWMSSTWPLVCNVKSWHLYSIEPILANLDGSLNVKTKSRVQFTEKKTLHEPAKGNYIRLMYFYLIGEVLFSPQSYFTNIFTEVINTFTASLSIIDRH